MPDNAIAAQVNPNAGLDTIGKYIGLQSSQLGVAQQRQNLQTGAIEQRKAAAEADQAQQRNRELQAVGNLISTAKDSNRYVDQDGKFNRQLFADDVAQVAPTYGQEVAGKAVSTANELVANRQAHSNLSNSFKAQMGAGFGSLATNDNLQNSDVIDELDRQLSINKDPEFRRMTLSMAAHLPQNATPQQLQAIMQRWSIAATQPETATAATMPRQTTNAASQVLNVKPTTGELSKPPQKGDRGASGFGPDLNPPSTAVGSVAANTSTANDAIQAARTAGDQVPLNRHINERLIDLSKDTSTGYGTQAWHKLIGSISGGKFTGDYQTIGAYLDRQGAMAAQTMGLPNTNAGLAQAAGATGTTEYSPQALQTKVKLADALNTGAGEYRKGLDRAVGFGPNPDPAKYQQFRAAWMENFDPRIFAIENAHRRGDKAEIASIVGEMTPAQKAQLAKQRIALTALTSGEK